MNGQEEKSDLVGPGIGSGMGQCNKSGAEQGRFRRIKAIKVLFAMEYVLQGLANPFQGITYQPFFKHFRFDYGLTEAATQRFFSQSYLAWSFKPILGFFMDAFGKTKVILTFLLSSAVILYFITPFFDISALFFFWMVFALAIVLAATDVAVDRATVIEGDEEAKESGRSKSATVGLNQAICWAAIYGTSIIAAISGGYIADHIEIDYLMYLLALVPLAVLVVVFFLPKDKAQPIPMKQSVMNFWVGLNTGPILWIMLFYFLFHFQPAMGALWTNYQIEVLGFSQTEIGFTDGATYVGYFIGVLLFASLGIRWMEGLGLRKLFKIFIILSIAVSLTQYVLVEPWFGRITRCFQTVIPTVELHTIRLAFLGTYNAALSVFLGFVAMCTFSLVGAVIPVQAAGSLFAGFMSVSNIAYSFSYASGAWLYENGLQYGIFQVLQENIFGIPAESGTNMSIALLILIGSLAYALSFIAAHMLPDRRQTLSVEESVDYKDDPVRYQELGNSVLAGVNWSSLAGMIMVFLYSYFKLELDPISSGLFAFFGIAFIRKTLLDWMYKRHRR